jgi:hypothetical protein
MDGLEISHLFDELEGKKFILKISGINFYLLIIILFIYLFFFIKDWGFSQSSLEDVFMEIVEDDY